MLYGEHTALVEEVIDFAFNGRALFATGPAEENQDAWITNDLRLAVVANGGEEQISRFTIAPQMDVSNWGNTELLGHNMQTGENLWIDDVREELSWTWHDLTENLVGLIWTTEWYQSEEQQKIHDLLFKKFISSKLEKELRQNLRGILPEVRPLEGWQDCAEHLANNMVSELWYCAENRAFNGMTDNLWERMFQLSSKGIWPCGWRGVYPSPGKFVAYRRAEPQGLP